jgi:hypothetical protein
MAVNNSNNNCNNCRYFSSGERLGICKRYPETINKSKDDYCGEFSSRPSTENIEINPFVQTQTVYLDAGKKKAGRPRKYA